MTIRMFRRVVNKVHRQKLKNNAKYNVGREYKNGKNTGSY